MTYKLNRDAQILADIQDTSKGRSLSSTLRKSARLCSACLKRARADTSK